ncbi:MAG: hypothetical protein ACPLYF_02765 [Fervidobacterium sp.]
MVEQNKSKTYYVLDKLEIDFILKLEEHGKLWDSYPEYLKKKLKLLALIIKLGHRNETLAKLLYLKNFYYFSEKPIKLEQYWGKHGKRETKNIPLKLIMEVLKCSHRSAQAYSLYLKGETLADEVWNASILELAKYKAEKVEEVKP